MKDPCCNSEISYTVICLGFFDIVLSFILLGYYSTRVVDLKSYMKDGEHIFGLYEGSFNNLTETEIKDMVAYYNYALAFCTILIVLALIIILAAAYKVILLAVIWMLSTCLCFIIYVVILGIKHQKLSDVLIVFHLLFFIYKAYESSMIICLLVAIVDEANKNIYAERKKSGKDNEDGTIIYEPYEQKRPFIFYYDYPEGHPKYLKITKVETRKTHIKHHDKHSTKEEDDLEKFKQEERGKYKLSSPPSTESKMKKAPDTASKSSRGSRGSKSSKGSKTSGKKSLSGSKSNENGLHHHKPNNPNMHIVNPESSGPGTAPENVVERDNPKYWNYKPEPE